jgi:holo-[acyl-carrier protein] synthase
VLDGLALRAVQVGDELVEDRGHPERGFRGEGGVRIIGRRGREGRSAGRVARDGGGMVVGVGTDLVELGRIEAALGRHGDALLERLFTPRERAQLADGRRRVERVAARFAAKEAALKALGTGWGQGVGWHDVEVLGGRGEPPRLAFAGPAERRLRALGAARAHVSLTHSATMAAAVVILE